MFEKIREIANAWVTSYSPTDEQLKLANERYLVCLKCPQYRKHRPVTNEEYCNECSCPIRKKIFTKTYDACPLHNWLDVENLYWEDTQKKKKTIL
jgi:hypothetical protein